MRKSRLLTAMLAVLMAATSFVACSDDNDWPLPLNVPNALVTVKPQPNGQQLLLQPQHLFSQQLQPFLKKP